MAEIGVVPGRRTPRVGPKPAVTLGPQSAPLGPSAPHDPDAPPDDLSGWLPQVTAVGEKYRYDAAHAQHVARLAGDLFAALTPFHGLSAAWRGPLEHAALLHDIGYFVGASRHHKHSRYLIRHEALLGDYPAPWRDIVALIAGNHRRRVRRGPGAWGRRRRAAATALAAILRIADGLDYGHDGAARLDGLRLRRGHLQLAVGGMRLGGLDAVLRKKSALFTQTFAVPIGFVPASR